ncbi:MAG TPA: hypothetical protein VIB99_09935 [Candidatus Limnocylindrales bacterium]|jgi:hypothetical protein
MPELMSAPARPGRRTVPRPVGRLATALVVVLAVLIVACSPATTPAPRATITFLVRNTTTTPATFDFSGSATVADVTGPLCRQAQTVVGTTWDPVWSFSINGQRAIGSTDSADLQPGASARDGLTVIIVISLSGVQKTAHAGPPLAGEADTPAPSVASPSTPTC